MNQHVMNVLDRSGHMRVEWSPTVPAEVDNARDIFDNMTEQGYQAFRVEGADRQGARIKEFDPTAAKIMLIPHLVGG
jgi:hypothetical protein